MWDAATAESKSKMIVCFEWEHITVGPRKKRHIVSISVTHALHDHRPPPKWPHRSRNEWFHFTVDGLNAFAELKMSGTSYHGVSYENIERREIIPDLPKAALISRTCRCFGTFPLGGAAAIRFISFAVCPRTNSWLTTATPHTSRWGSSLGKI